MATLKEIFPSTTSFENDALHIARSEEHTSELQSH